MATDGAEHNVDSGIPEIWPPRDNFDVDEAPLDEDEADVEDIECSTPQTRAAAFKRKGLMKKTTLPPPPRANAASSSGYPGVSWNKRMGAWLAFYYDNDTRRSRTFHPKYYDMDVEKAKIAAIDFMKGIEKHPRCSLRKTKREATGGSISGSGSASGNGNGASDSVRPLSPNLASVDVSLVHLNGQSLQSQSLQKHAYGVSGTGANTLPYRDVKTSRGTGSSAKRGHGSILRAKSCLYSNGAEDVLSSHSHGAHAKKNKSPVFDYNVVKRNFMLVNTRALDNAFSPPSANRLHANANTMATATTTAAMATPPGGAAASGETTTPDSRPSFCNVEPGLYYDSFDGNCFAGNNHNNNNSRGDGAMAGNVLGGARSWPSSQVFLDCFNQTPQKYALDQVYLEGAGMGYATSNIPNAHANAHAHAHAHANTHMHTSNPYFDQDVSGGNLYLDQTRSYESGNDVYLHGRHFRLDESESDVEIHRLMASVAPSGVDSFEGFKRIYTPSSSPFGSQDIYGSLYNNLASFNSASSMYASPCATSTSTTSEATLAYGNYPGFSNFVASLPTAQAHVHVHDGGVENVHAN